MSGAKAKPNTEPAGAFDASDVSMKLERWFERVARELPWRKVDASGQRNAYHALVAEAMLQQTQVSRVVPKFLAFIERFPTVLSLASATEQDVLACWSGLGYYRRAKALHTAAKQIVERFEGRVPADVADLRTLQGIGPYTAGAISSIAFDRPAAIVDGNVRRVIRRLTNDDRPLDDAAAERRVWELAGQLARATDHPGRTNEALMELGALVCTPKTPGCVVCPLRDGCGACAAGRQSEIPPPKRAATKREVRHAVARVSDGKGRLLVERRPPTGLWASMWQAPALEREVHSSSARGPGTNALSAAVGFELPTRPCYRFVHQTTHRTVRFSVYEAVVGPGAAEPKRGAFMAAAAVAELPMANPHRRILLGPKGG